jgi:hypothetical protein
MKQHEREFFISLIRIGKVYIQYRDLELVIIPQTIEQSFRSCQVYDKSYEQCYYDGLMTQDETEEWMAERGLWNYEDEEKLKGLQKDIEKLKVEIFNARNNDQLKERIRLYIRAGEKQLQEQSDKKFKYFNNTCEGIASLEKSSYVIKNTTYLNEKLYDFDDVSLSYVIKEYHDSILNEKQLRELARTEPWKSLWVTKDKSGIELFLNEKNQELTYNQKNIIIWSQLYDNIHESLDCPSQDVIDDDDMLDGWFIIQNKKRDKDRAEKEFEENVKSDKIKNASEVFIATGNKRDIDRVNSMNSIHGQNIKQQRFNMLKQKGTVEQHQFQDEKLKIQTQATNMYKGKFKGGN